MKSIQVSSLLSLLAQLSPSVAHLGMMRKHLPAMKEMSLSESHQAMLDDENLVTLGGGYFDQLLDHDDPSKGTFKQRYWWNAEFFEEGGPIFLFNPGEMSAGGATGYLQNITLPGYYAQQLKGAVILLEHRYWGESIPVETLTAETLQYLNLPNSVSDLTYFAKNVDCQFCEGSTCNSDENPWVLMGGSYSGALAAWTSQLDPGTFAAYHASSAVVEAIYDFWEYAKPIQEALPLNCSYDVNAVVQYIDGMLAYGSETDVTNLKTQFGLSALNNADFAEIVARPIFEWQSDQNDVISFCDFIENYTHWGNQSKYGVGLVAALEAYSTYVREYIDCGENGASCDTYADGIAWNNPSDLDGGFRQWQWMLCNEPFGWYQTGPPTPDSTSIILSALRPEHYQRRCALTFPETNGHMAGSIVGFTADHLNVWTKGWDAPYNRVIFVNGENDPWRSATVASEYRPGGAVQTSEQIPSLIVENASHVPDLVLGDNPSQAVVIEQAVEIMGNWLKDWTKPNPSRRA
ncbi:serine carboxypeptidase S28 [Nemania serpens]|nr:serine carboxypeptidase S28 [Nemania serpens]